MRGSWGMGTGAVAVAAPDRAKQCRGRHLWKKALLHVSLCFVVGFFTGFALSSSSSWKAATQHPLHRSEDQLATSRVAVNARVNLVPSPPDAAGEVGLAGTGSGGGGAMVDVDDEEEEAGPQRLLIVVTTTPASIRSGSDGGLGVMETRWHQRGKKRLLLPLSLLCLTVLLPSALLAGIVVAGGGSGGWQQEVA